MKLKFCCVAPKFKAFMNTILSTGYYGKMIEKVYIFLEPNDINEAFKSTRWYLSSMERHCNKNKCFYIWFSTFKSYYYERNSKNTIINSIRDSIGYSSNKGNVNLVNFNSKKDDKEENNPLLNEPLINY